MAKIEHSPGIESMIGARGKKQKHPLVERQKHFRDYDGKVTRIGRLEAYEPRRRNYAAAPVRVGERANQQSFGQASHLALEFINSLRNKTPLPPEKQAFLDGIMARFYAQLKGKPDPIAPKDKEGNYTIYARPDNFIRAVLRKEQPNL